MGALSLAADTHQFYLDDLRLRLHRKSTRFSPCSSRGDRPVSRERLTQQLYGLGTASIRTRWKSTPWLAQGLGKERIETRRGFGYRLVPL